jgi:hypothetical protein
MEEMYHMNNRTAIRCMKKKSSNGVKEGDA